MVKIREGILLMVFGLSGLVFGLASESLSTLEKVSITMICSGLIALGVFFESPRTKEWFNTPVDVEGESFS